MLILPLNQITNCIFLDIFTSLNRLTIKLNGKMLHALPIKQRIYTIENKELLRKGMYVCTRNLLYIS